MEIERFRALTVATLAKRAANTCSNPDCGILTSGPANDPAQSVNLGEAAHIYGASPGSARYRAEMVGAERGEITNAIWLCCTCHKLVDDDEDRFPAGLLFEWRRQHEQWISEQLGRVGEVARRRYLSRHLLEFEGLSYLAEQIISDRPDHWEFKLTAEVLRLKTEPVMRRWDYLNRGLYTRPMLPIGRDDVMSWVQARLAEVTPITEALSGIINREFQRAWGAPGVPGSDLEIVRVCQLFADACAAALDWEERIRFADVPHAFEEPQRLLTGHLGRQLDEVAKVPTHLSKIFDDPRPAGTHSLSITFEMADEWPEMFNAAVGKAVKETFAID
jgi:hypothetical protein